MAAADEEMEMSTWDEDADVEAGMRRDKQLMEKLDVGETVLRDDVPRDSRTWTGRWCHREKGGGVRSPCVIRQYAAEAWNEDAFSGTLGWVCAFVLLHCCTPSEARSRGQRFSAAFVHTPLDEKEHIYVEPP